MLRCLGTFFYKIVKGSDDKLEKGNDDKSCDFIVSLSSLPYQASLMSSVALSFKPRKFV